MTEDSTPQLTREMAAGDPAAIEAFYREYFELMYREARRCTGPDESTGLDVVHESMLKLLRYMRPLPTRTDLECWIRRLVKTVALDHLRKAHRRLNREQRLATPEHRRGSPPEREIIQARIVWLEEMLHELDDQAARLLKLRYFQGWTLQRIATMLGIKPGAVDRRIQRLVCELREQARGLEHD